MGAVLAVLAALLIPSPAHANPTLPSPQSWTNGPLQEMLRISGNISLSVAGSGFATQTGTIAVEKPANSTVIAAYLTTACMSQTVPSVLLEGQPVTYTHHAEGSGNSSNPASPGAFNRFSNHFADVTSLVKTTIDSHTAGRFTLSLNDGSTHGQVDGQELVVIFQDPAKGTSSVILMFGSSLGTGDQFTLSFPALSDLTAQKASLSLGIGHSYQTPTNRDQYSTVEISTSSNSTLQPVSNTAGGYDDGTGAGALVTVGGIDDSLDLPALTPLANDDELYGLNSFLNAGDTSLTLATGNPYNDDTLFQAVFYFEGVALQGAVATQVAPYVPPVNTPSTPATVSQELANTGMNNSLFMASGALGMSLIILGGVMVFARRMQSNQNS